MAANSATLEQLFERTWRPGHPFRGRLGRFRRYGMPVFLFLLCTVIGAYLYYTDSQRLRGMCQNYLSQLVGGRVIVKHANLSIFEGLKLEDVKVLVDEGHALDSEVFEAQTLDIKYNPLSILSGDLEATQIRAIDARIRLCEDAGHHWNYQRMGLPAGPAGPPGKPLKLPEISLRHGWFEYSKLQDNARITLGAMAFDGQLTPENLTTPGKESTYQFNLQSRGGRSDMPGPQINGTLVTTTGEISGRFGNFQFGTDIEAILPDQVQQWCKDHQLSGRIDIPSYYYKPPQQGDGAFRVVMTMSEVNLAIEPREWMSDDEISRSATIAGAMDLLRVAGLNLPPRPTWTGPNLGNTQTPPQRGFADRLGNLMAPVPLRLSNVEGHYIFDQDGITIDHASGYLEHNAFNIKGHVSGYSLDAAANIDVKAENLYIEHSPPYLNSLPGPAHELYEHLHPEGTCTLNAHIERPPGGNKPIISGTLQVIDGKFIFDRFPYPLRKTTGLIEWGPDAQMGDRCNVHNLTGLGIEGGCNENTAITINGTFAPLTGGVGCSLKVEAKNVTSEPALRAAFPADVDESLNLFDAPGKGEFPRFHGDFVCNVTRDVGLGQPWHASVDLDLDDASGSLVAFPYPLDHIHAKVAVRAGHADIVSATAQRGDASVKIDGIISYGKNQPIDPELRLSARNVKIDETLLAALPNDRSAALKSLGLGGVLESIEGKIFLPPRHDSTTQPAVDPSVDLDLNMKLRDGVIHPSGSTLKITDVTGDIALTGQGVVLSKLTGKRRDTKLDGDGVVTWQHGEPQVTLNVAAKNLLLDEPLRAFLPTRTQAQWDQVQPKGTLDMDLQYNYVPTATASDTKVPGNTAPNQGVSSTRITLTPRKLSITPKLIPYRLDDLGGAIVVQSDRILLQKITARHGDAELLIDGNGSLGDHPLWDLQLSGRHLTANDDLRKALPPSLAKLMATSKLSGDIAVDLHKLTWLPADSDAAGQNDTLMDSGDLTIGGTVWFTGADLDVGVPLGEVNSKITFATQVHAGRIGELLGTISADSMRVASRSARNFHADMYKPANQYVMRIDKMGGELAGGEMAGQIDVTFPDTGQSRFALQLVLRNADVRELAGETSQDLKGQLTASLALEGAWAEPATRRGRGDVSVSGKEMYKIPLVLGLLQITNLALPISSPFNEGDARYSVDGQKVTFESIEMRARNMVMQGSGTMDFDSKKVHMTFVTDNPNWPKLPLVQGLIEGAKHEMFQIHVNGTVEAPKVSGSVMNTFQTTIDEVFKADSVPASSGKH